MLKENYCIALHCQTTHQEHQTLQIQVNSTPEAPNLDLNRSSLPVLAKRENIKWHTKHTKLSKIQTLGFGTWIKAIDHSPQKKSKKEKVKAQIDDHPTCMELAVLAVHVPHPSPPEPEPANAGRSGPRSSPPAGGVARVRPNREAWRECGRWIGVSSGCVWPGFSSRLPSPSSCCCRTGAPQHSGSSSFTFLLRLPRFTG